MIKEHQRVRIPNPHRGDIGPNLLRSILREVRRDGVPRAVVLGQPPATVEDLAPLAAA
jgi:hypothetical protein